MRRAGVHSRTSRTSSIFSDLESFHYSMERGDHHRRRAGGTYRRLRTADAHRHQAHRAGKSAYMGGISRTVNYKGNRIDIGGHRFFSKSDRVMEWWLRHHARRSQATAWRSLPNQTATLRLLGSRPMRSVMLLRNRKSRIYFLRKFFEYPDHAERADPRKSRPGAHAAHRPQLSSGGRCSLRSRSRIWSSSSSAASAASSTRLFFKSYTEKVWGIPCSGISAEWGAQRIKGLSITKSVLHVLKKMRGRRPATSSRRAPRPR